MVLTLALTALGVLVGHFWGVTSITSSYADMIDFCNAQTLNHIGDRVGIKKQPLEPDAHYRARLKRGLGR